MEAVVDMHHHRVVIAAVGTHNPRPQEAPSPLTCRLGHTHFGVVPAGIQILVAVVTAWVAGQVVVAGTHRDWLPVWVWVQVGSMVPGVLVNSGRNPVRWAHWTRKTCRLRQRVRRTVVDGLVQRQPTRWGEPPPREIQTRN